MTVIEQRILQIITLLYGFVSVILASGTTGRTTTLATFNAALSNSTGNVDARASILINQMIQSDIDILCLQEIWSSQQQRKLRADLKPFYPYALSAVDLENEPSNENPACPSSQLGEYFTCREQRCEGRTGVDFSTCGTLSCLEVAIQLPESCLRCLFFEVNASNRTSCVTTPAAEWEETYGLMLLSKKELINPTANPFNNISLIRGYLTATVDGVGDLICTHLSTPLLPPPFYAGPPLAFPLLYSSYAEQQQDEVMTLLDFIAKSGAKVPILLGDFNHGPTRTDGIVAELPFNYGIMSARGFISPYVLKDGRCTFCADNPLTSMHPTVIVDHIYITIDTTERVIFAKRFMDVVFPSIGTALSDHYGVVVRLSDIRSNCNYIQTCRFHCMSEIKEFSTFQPNLDESC